VLSAVCALLRLPEARLCWSDLKACCDAETLLDAAMYCEKLAVDKAAIVMVTLLRGQSSCSLPDSSSLFVQDLRVGCSEVNQRTRRRVRHRPNFPSE